MTKIFALVPHTGALILLYQCFHVSLALVLPVPKTPVVPSRLLLHRCRRLKSISLNVMDMGEYVSYGDENESGVQEDEDELSDEELEATMGEWDDRIARLNTVHLTGRIGNNAEPRYFDDGKVVLNLSFATKRKYVAMERKGLNMRSGEEETMWLNLEIWGQTAEFAAKFVDKGSRVGIIGQLQNDQWIDKESGEPRSRAKIIVRELDILETKAEAEMRRSNRRGSSVELDDDGGPFPAGRGGFFDQ